jgi:hypothetical protein
MDQPSPLLALPAELRIEIFRYLTPPETSLRLSNGLRCTNGQIRAEFDNEIRTSLEEYHRKLAAQHPGCRISTSGRAKDTTQGLYIQVSLDRFDHILSFHLRFLKDRTLRALDFNHHPHPRCIVQHCPHSCRWYHDAAVLMHLDAFLIQGLPAAQASALSFRFCGNPFRMSRVILTQIVF